VANRGSVSPLPLSRLASFTPRRHGQSCFRRHTVKVAREDNKEKPIVDSDSNTPPVPLPHVWVLTNPHPGNRIQAIALAEALGWPFEVKELHFAPWNRQQRRFPFLPLTFGLDRRKSPVLAPPWPDLVIGVGLSTAPITRWIGLMSKGRTRTVQLGRGGGSVASNYDAVVTPLHCRMPPDPRRYDTIAPLNSISLQQLSEASSQWPGLLEGVARPVIVLLVGGDTPRFRISADDATRMALNVRQWAEEGGGSVMAVTSRRTSQDATRALQSVLEAPHRVYRWQPDRSANPYRALLAQADVLVVTGESESMLAEAAATTAPLYIYPVKEVPTRIRSRLREWCVSRAHASFSREHEKDGLASPVDALFAWLMRHGLLRTRRDMDMLHQALFHRGRALPFGKPLQTAPQKPLPPEAQEVARWLKELLY
jgi:mitochondrial fission protein ELM1